MTKKKTVSQAPEFLAALLEARSPSGYEFEAQKVLDTFLKPAADKYEKDVMGNRMATLNPKGDPVLMFSGHMDELGFIVRYIDSKGYVYFDTIGGHDLVMISGRRVRVMTDKGDVKGVMGKRAIHLMTPEERKRVPELHHMWIDIGAKNKKEAEKLITIGDPIIYDHAFEMLSNSIGMARAFDNKAGCYVVSEALRRLSKDKKGLNAQVVSVATTQEEIGVRGAMPSCYHVNPDFGIAVDVTHATDHPDCDKKKFGECLLGGGPVICRGPNINPIVFDKLVSCAKKLKIPYQLEAEARPTGTDARALQISRKGVATGLVAIPLRYMHTPSELVDMEDVENCVKLLMSFAKSLKKGERGVF